MNCGILKVRVCQFYSFSNSLLDDLSKIGVQLVGAYDVLERRFDNWKTDKEKCSPLLHWRYVQDLPECQTVIVIDSLNVHVAYWRYISLNMFSLYLF
jgi:hypothetical protein